VRFHTGARVGKNKMILIYNQRLFMRRSFALLFIIIFCYGCSTISNNKASVVSLAPDINFKLLDLWKTDHEITLNQHFQGSYQEKQYSFNLVSQITKDKMTVIGLTAFGARVFTLEYDGKNVDFKLSSLVKDHGKIKPEYLLADMQLVYYPVAEIQKNMIGHNIKIKEIKNDSIRNNQTRYFIKRHQNNCYWI
jgi:hypothetical protein